MTISVKDSSGTPQTVDTIDDLIAMVAKETGGNLAAIATLLGSKTDARSIATDGTSVSLESVAKQISQSLQLIQACFGSTALDLGSGTGGSRTLRVINDTSQVPAIKAASTAPVATDTAMVVALSPNSVNPNGQAVMANSAPVVIASNQSSLPVTPADQYSQYETVAASQTAQAMGATGATGDYLAGVLVFPGAAGCGVVTILDNATTIGTFAGGGTTALPSLVPFMIPIGLVSVSGAWKITTGANVTVVGIGKFT